MAEAQTLAQPEEFDYLGLLDERYSSVRKFAPLLLAHFEFHAAPAADELLQALNLLRDFNASGKRTLPEHVPTGFVKPRWRPHVFASGGVDRHFYELCALAELRDRLRAGDIWVTGSRQYRDFETYLIPSATFEVSASGIALSSETRPCVDRIPKSPQWLPGARTEPPVSLPIAKSHRPLDTAAADPLDEPPGIRSGTTPLRGVPKCAFLPFIENASSSVTVLPTKRAPESSNA